MVVVPETQYARLGPHRIAYQVLGEGPPDLVLVPPLGDCIDVRWDYGPQAAFLHRLAAFSRLIMFDRRGMGASDRVPHQVVASWEAWVEDAQAVLDTVGSERAAILGGTEAGIVAMLFAATHPEQTQALVLVNPSARFTLTDDYPSGLSEEATSGIVSFMKENWGTPTLAGLMSPELADDDAFVRFVAKGNRLACSPSEAAAYFEALQLMDIRHLLPTIRVPTLVLHRKDAPWVTFDQGRYVADHIPGARFVPLPGSDLNVWGKPNAQLLNEVEAFLTGVSPRGESDRALAAVLFTDIVGSTERAMVLGDRRWRSLLETHDRVVGEIVEQHRGRLVKSTGDGLLATFDGPGRAIRCATVLIEAVRPLGIEIRAGLHTGEIELVGQDIAGIAVHIAQRVCALANANEVFVSRTVTDLVAGSGIEFDERGEHELKGIPGTWRLYAVEG